MNEKTAVLELKELQSDINNLLVPDEFDKPTITVGSIKTQIISRFIEGAKKKLKTCNPGIRQAFKDAGETLHSRCKGARKSADLDCSGHDDKWGTSKKCERCEYDHGVVRVGTIWWIVLIYTLFLVSILPTIFMSFGGHPIQKIVFYLLTLTSIRLNPHLFYAWKHLKGNRKEYKKIKEQLNSELDKKLVRIETDKAYLVSQIQEQLSLNNTQFKNRFIDLEASFKKMASEPRDRAKEAIRKLERQKEKVASLSDRVSCQENRDRMVKKINETIQNYEQFIAELAPKEEKLLTSAINIKEQLQHLESRIGSLDSIQVEYQEYQNLIDELGEHSIKLEYFKNEHSSNMEFIQSCLNELGQDVVGIHQAIGDCRYLLPGFELSETLALPEPEVKQIAASVS